ncbi:VanZ family protein [Paenibacillus algorifonticola]|uniref:VanZ family protein n=1 Tax=Paenibacillus algorifonticola TaxID=684063 RepID=UPI003D26F8E5
MKSTTFNKNKILKYTFIFYILFLFNFIAIKFFGDFSALSRRIDINLINRKIDLWNINLIPFKSIEMAYHSYKQFGVINNDSLGLIFNIVVFLPLGFLSPYIFKKTFIKQLLFFLLIIIAIEGFQFVTLLGIADIDDVILNMTGSVLGYLIYKVTRSRFN